MKHWPKFLNSSFHFFFGVVGVACSLVVTFMVFAWLVGPQGLAIEEKKVLPWLFLMATMSVAIFVVLASYSSYLTTTRGKTPFRSHGVVWTSYLEMSWPICLSWPLLIVSGLIYWVWALTTTTFGLVLRLASSPGWFLGRHVKRRLDSVAERERLLSTPVEELDGDSFRTQARRRRSR